MSPIACPSLMVPVCFSPQVLASGLANLWSEHWRTAWEPTPLPGGATSNRHSISTQAVPPCRACASDWRSWRKLVAASRPGSILRHRFQPAVLWPRSRTFVQLHRDPVSGLQGPRR